MDRRAAWSALAVSTAVWVILAAWLVPWEWTPVASSLRPPRAEDVFTSGQIDRAEDYAGVVRPLSWASYAASLTAVLTLAVTRTGQRLVRRVQGPRPWWVAVPLAVLLVLLAGRLLTLPFSVVIRRRNLEEGLTAQALSPWLVDRALSLAVSWALMSLLGLLVIGAARHTPRRWFLLAGAAVASATFAVSLLYPVLVEPLFNTFTPMRPGLLRTSLLQLAQEEGVEVGDVLVADASKRTTTLNAYVSGLDRTGRLVVYDTLLDALPPRQVRTVVAHELSHARFHDVMLGTGLASVAGFAGVCGLALLLDSRAVRRRTGTTGPDDPAVILTVLAAVAWATFAASPVQNTVSRAMEVRADRAALQATGDVSAFRSVQRKLALRSLADPTPPRLAHVWFASHPTVLQRLGLADVARGELR